MIVINKKLAIGATAATVVISALLEFSAAGQGNTGVTVCVGSDSIMRSPASGICPSGSRQIKLAGPVATNQGTVDQSDPLGPTKTDEGKLDLRLYNLEKRLGQLENAPLFEVVNDQDDVIFSVTPQSVQLYNRNKFAVAAMFASSEGGQFVARSGDGKLATYFGAYGDRAGLRVAEGDNPRLDLLRQPGGNYSIRIRRGDGDIAGIGESKAGTGAIVIGDATGTHRAAIEIDGGRPSVSIFNKTGQGVASLSQSQAGGGLLVLANAGGAATVLMKPSNDNRYGVVMALPSGLPYVPKSGLPGSYMLGCAGGKACIP